MIARPSWPSFASGSSALCRSKILSRSPQPQRRCRSVAACPTVQRRPCWKKTCPTSRRWNAGWQPCLTREGDALRAGNLLLRARLREQAERERLAAERRTRAAVIIERHQWLAAVTAFANPVLALGPMAVGAVQLKMLSEMAAAYDAQPSSEFVETVGHQMAHTLLKLGVAEAVASVLAGIFKFNPLGFAAGGVVQAVTMGYLTRLTGASFVEYLEHGQTWGKGGMQAALTRQLEETAQVRVAHAVCKTADSAPVPALTPTPGRAHGP